MKTGSKDAELKQELIRRGVRKIGWFLADALDAYMGGHEEAHAKKRQPDPRQYVLPLSTSSPAPL